MKNQELAVLIESAVALPDLHLEVQETLRKNPRTIVVLDDDPTGTQTVYDIPVLAEWTTSVLERELLQSPIFFILTNSRSLQTEDAHALGSLLGKRLHQLAIKHKKDLLVISRGDSTLRGHYPNEVIALAKGLQIPNAQHILAPAFFEGGRYTYEDIHYVREGSEFIPAAKTPFAKDNTFGYANSHLKKWILEKYEHAVSLETIHSFSLQQLREIPHVQLLKIVSDASKTHCIVNAVCYHDLQVAALVLLQLKTPFILRTAASFVNAIAGIPVKECITKKEILTGGNRNGALMVIGSYVPKTTEQLAHLKETSAAKFLEFDASLVARPKDFERHIQQLAISINESLKKSEDVVLYTSRKLISGEDKSESLSIVNAVSLGLISVVQSLTVQPKYILAKGGITSSDVATKGLDVKRAIVLGQLIKGVPVWRLGNESKFPNMPYIVFPGNVGTTESLTDVIQKLS